VEGWQIEDLGRWIEHKESGKKDLPGIRAHEKRQLSFSVQAAENKRETGVRKGRSRSSYHSGTEGPSVKNLEAHVCLLKELVKNKFYIFQTMTIQKRDSVSCADTTSCIPKLGH